MQYIDTHVHLQDFNVEYVKDIITAAISLDVKKMICVGSRPDDWKKVEEIYRQYPNNVIPAVGLHPWYVEDAGDSWAEILEEHLIAYPQSLVGEIGLDGIKGKKGQLEVFEQQLILARDYRRPVIIHAVKAQNWFEDNWHLLPEKFVFHSYNGKKEFLKEIIKHGGHVSFSFSVLKNKELAELVDIVPIRKLLLETDSPYQASEAEEENEPALIPQLYREIAQTKGMNLKEFAEQVYANAMEFVKVG